MEQRSTIVVSPRERYSPTIESLKSLFASIPSSVPVVVVDGAFPLELRAQLQALSQARPFRHVMRDWPLLPNEARNIGTAHVDTEFAVYSDNDVLYEPGWLQALEAHADRTGVEIVAPLTCIGPPKATTIHQAGGVIRAFVKEQRLYLKEVHNLSNRPIGDLQAANLPAITDTGEFHCIFVRTSLMKRLGCLDERLLTREHNDFALRARHAGARIGFEPAAVVTYNAKTRLEPGDLAYHLFRWNHRDAVRSIDAFEKTWGVTLNRRGLLKTIRNRRRYRILEAFARLRRLAGRRFVWHVAAPLIERGVLWAARRPAATRQLPPDIPPHERSAMLAQLIARDEVQEKRAA